MKETEPKIVNQQAKWVDEERCILMTKWSNGAVSVDNITTEEYSMHKAKERW